jgi:fatty acid desaturase
MLGDAGSPLLAPIILLRYEIIESSQIAGLPSVYAHVHVRVAVCAWCWVLLIGTYLPHRAPTTEGVKVSDYPDEHRSRSNDMPTWLSLITCYHFGYHREHHE